MTVNQVLIKVRRMLNDMSKLKYSDEELIYCLNNAIDAVSLELADNKTPDFVKECTIEAGSKVERPEDFIDFVGQYPVAFTEEGEKVIMELLDDQYPCPMIVRYFAMRPKVKLLTDKVPFFREWQLNRLIKYTVTEADPTLAMQPQNGGEGNGR